MEERLFWIDSSLNEAAIVEFFTKTYCPSPIVAPWNGGSGFHPKDNQVAIDAIVASRSGRYEIYRKVINECQKILIDLGKDPLKEDVQLALEIVCLTMVSLGLMPPMF